jgi:hypothetical protein
MKSIFIHVGIAKSATTWMQNVLFSNQNGLNYLGKDENNYPEWLIDWAHLDDFEFNKRKSDLIATFQKKIKNGINLLSSESFTNKGAIFNIANRIKFIAPNAKIIITLRDPINTIFSHYKHYVKFAGYFRNLDAYLEFGRRPRDIVYRNPIYIADFLYDEMINTYAKLFDNQVLVLKYEDMVYDYESFIEGISQFMDLKLEYRKEEWSIKKNASINDNCLKEMRINNFQNQFSLYLSDSSVTGDYSKYFSDTFYNEETIKKIKTFIRGKCYGYY